MGVARQVQSTPNKQFVIPYTFQKEMRDKFDFCMKTKIKLLRPSFLVAIAKHTQNTQNNKFPLLLQYFRKEGSDKVVYLHGDKEQPFLKVDTIKTVLHGQSWPNYYK